MAGDEAAIQGIDIPVSTLVDRTAYIEAARRGVSGRVVGQAVSVLGRRQTFAGLMGTTVGNLNRFYHRPALGRAQSEALLDMLRVVARGSAAFGDVDRLQQWLDSAPPAFGRRTAHRPVRHLRGAPGRRWCPAEDSVRRVSLRRLYRISDRRHIGDLRGLGASFETGGRWNRAGVPVLYFAVSAAVAMLEMAHHLPSPRLVPPGYRMGVFEASDRLRMDRWSIEDLPADWSAFPYPASTQELGSTWLLSGKAELLAVPSTAIPGGLDDIVLASPARLGPKTVCLVETLADLYSDRAFAQI